VPRSTPLAGSANLGPTIIKRLNEVDIHSREDLQRVGAASAYRRIRAKNPGKTMPVCYYLYSLEGALRDVHWDDLPVGVKERLIKEAKG
jgi:DNA transformation protein